MTNADIPFRKRSPANLMSVDVKRVRKMADDREFLAVVFRLSDGSHKYTKFGLPCNTTSIMQGLRELADEIEQEYHL